MLGQKLLNGDKVFAEAWNFGPEQDGNQTVCDILSKLKLHLDAMRWHVSNKKQPHEAKLLYLDSAKARIKLGWEPVWNIDAALKKTAEWYLAWLDGCEIISQRQLTSFLDVSALASIEWAYE